MTTRLLAQATRISSHSERKSNYELQRDFQQEGREAVIVGLEEHDAFSEHPHSARRRQPIGRVTVIAEAELESRLTEEFVRLGAKGFTVLDCRGGSVHTSLDNDARKVRIETIVPGSVGNKILAYLDSEIHNKHAVATTVENVDIVQNGYS